MRPIQSVTIALPRSDGAAELRSVRGWYIGLMSGTSLDGIDGVVARFDEARTAIAAHAYAPFDVSLRAQLAQLNAPGENEIHRAQLAANAFARANAEVVHRLLATSGLASADIEAIGSHGQTVRHRPGEFDGLGYTVQLDNPGLLAELTGINVVADFRRQDVAAGGQGAPLVPAFHRAVFGRPDCDLAVLNIGGISNLTVLPSSENVTGFDCGPGNILLDAWCEEHTGHAFDSGGEWGARGQVDAFLLGTLLSDPYFSAQPPKSTGRDRFNRGWLDQALKLHHKQLLDVDVQATLCELTVQACAMHVVRYAPRSTELVVCGGGALNADLMHRLCLALPNVQVVSSGLHGVAPTQVEAAAFAWLARAYALGFPGNLPECTGANGPRVLGGLYRAHPGRDWLLARGGN
jgi:anhydro-N-acetylmuramic acid kinase